MILNNQRSITIREDYKMKNLVIVLMIILTISIAGGLYNTLQHLDYASTTGRTEVAQFPQEVSTLTLNPMPVVPLH